jgi:alpha-N-acetylglucosaminidase
MEHKLLSGLYISVAIILLSSLMPAKGQGLSGDASCRATIEAMIERWFPGRSSDFLIEEKDTASSADWFAVESNKDKIQISGNSTLSIASGFNWYLKHYCHVDIAIQGERVILPRSLPPIKEKIYKRNPFKIRYFFNYCTFGYTMAWWDWQRWEKLIDWMAMNGINMPLAITGQEAVWQQLLKEYKFTDQEIRNYLTGPAYLPWEWMGNIDGLTGPLPEHWISSHEILEKKILKRERTFGMKPVLQGFTGHVPKLMKEKFPGSKIVQTTDWAGMPGTYVLDPRDTLFEWLGKRFIDIQTQLYGTNHLYDADCFNEVNPPSKDTTFIKEYSASIYKSMTSADPKATWVMQGWFLYWQKSFWKEPQANALLDAIPPKHLILLDLWGEKHPVWKETESFYGKPWVWNIICNLGQQVNLSGDFYQIYKNFREAFTSSERGDLEGIGVMMEGFGYNPVVQEFMGHLVWSPQVDSIPEWISNYAMRRYGIYNDHAIMAWNDLLSSVYSHAVSDGDIISSSPGEMVPDVSKKNPYGAGYNAANLFSAVKELLLASDELKDNKNYQFDLVNTVREMLSLKANVLFIEAKKAADSNNLSSYKKRSAAFINLLKDMDMLLGTNKHFLLGKWINDARKWGNTEKERRYYEWNARTIITLWEPFPESHLKDYAAKEWNGMVGDYYMHRWEQYFKITQSCIQKGIPFDRKKFDTDIAQWEYNWTHKNNHYIAIPQGDPVRISRQLYNKYKQVNY